MTAFRAALFVPVVLSACAAAQVPPAPAGFVVTEPELKQSAYEYERRVLTESFEAKHGELEPGTPDAEYVELAARAYTGLDSWDELSRRARSGELGELTHPHVPAVDLWFTADHTPAGLARFEQALDDMRDGGVHPACLAVHAIELVEFADNLGDESASLRARRAAIAEAIRAGSEPGLDWRARRRLYDVVFAEVIDFRDGRGRPIISGALDGAPDLDPWLSEMSRAGVAHMRAWEERGRGFANETTEEQFFRFHKHMTRSGRHYQRALEIDPKCPEPASIMIRIVLSVGDDAGTTEWEWFVRATVVQPGYASPYDKMRQASQLRWGGSFDALARLALYAAENGPPDSGIPHQALITFGMLMDEYVIAGGSRGHAFRHAELVDGLIAMLERGDFVLPADTTPDGRHSRLYARSALAYLASRTGKADLAEKTLRDMDGWLSDDLKRDWKLRTLRLEGEIIPFVSAGREAALEASAAESRADWDAAVDAWARALEAVEKEGDEAGVRSVTHRLTVATQTAAFERGEWVEVTIDEHYSGLCIGAGLWDRVDDRTIAGHPAPEELTVFLGMRPGDRYVFEGDVRVQGKARATTSAGLAFTAGTWRESNVDAWRTLVWRPAHSVYALGWYWLPDARVAEAPPPGEWRTMRIVQRADRVVCSIDGVEIRDGRVPDFTPHAEPEKPAIGFGGWDTDADNPVMFRNIRVRRLRPDDLRRDDVPEF